MLKKSPKNIEWFLSHSGNRQTWSGLNIAFCSNQSVFTISGDADEVYSGIANRRVLTEEFYTQGGQKLFILRSEEESLRNKSVQNFRKKLSCEYPVICSN